ncbi:MAG: XRE family transcriptional regulator [Candidatus Moeniiplasma glomeromycotorum]|nr:XRE family transcriptional regulator [Candidatus Moeniiplasma glomeromycotorum]MCE8167691.1 XRE family transcriptional regulator [Candidatus Moeniiplasma glomeromycotorum]MCE8169240.1 XRE family transcriptional regulator [Candidatus Moeniiplasma glomeromycotorum]
MLSRKIKTKKSPPKKVVENIRKEMTNPNFPYKNIGLSSDAAPEEKMKYDICQKILAYQQDNELSTKEVAESIHLTEPETEDIFFARINKFTLDRLVAYATSLGITLKIEEVKSVVPDSRTKLLRSLATARKNANQLRKHI